MPVRMPKTVLSPRCKECWQEVFELLKLHAANIQHAENVGRSVDEHKNLWKDYMDWWERNGWEYFPADMPSQVVE